MDGMSPYVDGLPLSCRPVSLAASTYLAAFINIVSFNDIVIFIVRPLFKRNLYLSLLCDWMSFILILILFFLSSKCAVEACDIYIYVLPTQLY
jgi:hypothetical protein